jgi:hypothetical protein
MRDDANQPDRTPRDDAHSPPAGATSPPLRYMPPSQDEAVLTRERHFRSAGALLSALSVFGLVFVFIIANIHHPGPPPPGGTTLGPAPATGKTIAGPALCAAVVVAVLGGVVWYHWHLHRSRAFAVGILIGVGIAALIEGACFAILGR